MAVNITTQISQGVETRTQVTDSEFRLPKSEFMDKRAFEKKKKKERVVLLKLSYRKTKFFLNCNTVNGGPPLAYISVKSRSGETIPFPELFICFLDSVISVLEVFCHACTSSKHEASSKVQHPCKRGLRLIHMAGIPRGWQRC